MPSIHRYTPYCTMFYTELNTIYCGKWQWHSPPESYYTVHSGVMHYLYEMYDYDSLYKIYLSTSSSLAYYNHSINICKQVGIMYNVHCAVYLLYSKYSVQCTVNTVYSVQCTR